jgi:hypothetical protein
MLYPEVASLRARVIVRDIVFLCWILGCLWLGNAVHDQVVGLTALTDDVRAAGKTLEDGFDDAAGSVDDAPVVGDRLAKPLRRTGDDTGGRLQGAADRQDRRIRELARNLALLIGGLPLVLAAALYLPGRGRLIMQLGRARRFLREEGDPARRHVLATRAVCELSFGELLAHTKDPVGDLAADRYGPLLDALAEHHGLRRAV